MDYEQFKEEFIDAVKERLAEQGSNMNVSVNEVKKLNESYEAMTVTPEGSRVGVNIGIERFYRGKKTGTKEERYNPIKPNGYYDFSDNTFCLR